MMRTLINFVLFQAGWTACVLGAARGQPALGPAFVAAVVAVHLALQPRRRRELALIGCSALLGTLLDSLLVASGVLSFAGPSLLPWMCPPWITALWANFATTLSSSLRWLQGRVVLAAVLGAAGGPLAYWAGARLGAVDFGPQAALGLAALAVEWAAAMPLLSLAARRWCAGLPRERRNALASAGVR